MRNIVAGFKKALSLTLSVFIAVGTLAVGYDDALITEAAAVEKIIYVSANGSDISGDGSKGNPLASLAAAKNASKSGDIIELEGGTYYLDAPVEFNECRDITVRSKNGEKAVISGGYNVVGWTDGVLNGKYCKIAVIPYNIVKNMGGVYTLYNSNGEMLVNSRFPNKGYKHIKSVGSQTKRTFFCESGDASWLSGEALAKAIIRIDHKWVSETSTVKGFNREMNEITLSLECNQALEAGDNYFFENVKHGFDAAGEWYFDYAACKLYYIPKSGETNPDLILGITDKLININGGSKIKFENIGFENTNWTYCNDGGASLRQSAQGCDSCITVRNSTGGIEFNGCTFTNIGNTALSFGHEESGGKVIDTDGKNIVTGCKFINIGNSAIAVGAGSGSDNHCKGFLISDNLVSGYGRMYHHASGIIARIAEDCEISHNEVHDGYYTGISVGWTWGYKAAYGGSNSVHHNLVYNIGHTALCDMSGIYFIGKQTNGGSSSITNNIVFGVEHTPEATTSGAWGIYLDEGSMNVNVENNIVHDCIGGFHQNFGQDNTVHNNIFALNRGVQVQSSSNYAPSENPGPQDKYYVENSNGRQFTLTNNILAADNGYIYGQFRNDSFFSDDNNIYWDYTLGAEVRSSGSITVKSDIISSGKTNDYSGGKFINPGFKDYQSRDFSFADPAPSGFSAIDISDIGSSTYGSRDRYDSVRLMMLNEEYYYTGAEYEAYKAACVSSDTAEISAAYSALKNTEYTITLDTDGGTAAQNPVKYNGISVITLPVPAKSGFSFMGWQTEDGKIFGAESYRAGSGSYTLKAVYNADPVTSTDGYRFIYFDNIATLADSNINTSGGTRVKDISVDYSSNSISFTTTESSSDCFMNEFAIKYPITPGHRYKIYYDFYVNGTKTTSGVKMTLNAKYWRTDHADKYYNSWESGRDYVAEEISSETVMILRPGCAGLPARTKIEYRNIRIEDVSWGTGSDRAVCDECVRAVRDGQPIGEMPTERCSDQVFIGWCDVYDNPAKGIVGTKYTPASIPGKNVAVFPAWKPELSVISEKEMKFLLDFGGFGLAEVTVSGKIIGIEKKDGVWNAEVYLTGRELADVLEESGINESCELADDDGLLLTAQYENGEWVTERTEVRVKRLSFFQRLFAAIAKAFSTFFEAVAVRFS